jgi:hypothetical protein
MSFSEKTTPEFDVNSTVGAVGSLISHFGKQKKEKEEFEAQKLQLKKKINEENRYLLRSTCCGSY